MENEFVADGYERFLCGKKTISMESIQKEHAKELAAASRVQKQQIREHLAQEFLHVQNHKSSTSTLW
jgi:hypothetical protein